MRTSGGTNSHSRVPTIKDDVFFDENSFTTDGQQVQIDILIAEVNDLDFSEITKSATIETIAAGRDITVFGSLYMNDKVKSNLPNLIIASKSRDAVVNSAGIHLARRLTLANTKILELTTDNRTVCDQLVISGTGTVTLKDSLLVANEILIYSGQFRTSSKYISSNGISIKGGSARVDLMKSIIDVKNWSINRINTFSAGNSTISVNNPIKGSFHGAGYTYYDVALCGKISVSGDNSFHELTFCEGSDIQIKAGHTQTVKQLIAEGTPGNPIRISSDIFDEEAFIRQNSGSLNASSLSLEDIHAKGGADFNASNSVDMGNVEGWNITAPAKKTYYWVRGSGNWSDYENHWATTSGGSQFHEGLPTVYDDVIFDKNSFSSSSEVVIDLYHAYAGNMDWTGVDDPVLIRQEQNDTGKNIKIVRLHIFGSYYFNKNASSELEYIRFKNDENGVVDSKGRAISGTLNFYHTGVYSILAHSQLLSGSVNLEREGATIIEDSVLIEGDLNMFQGELIVDSSYISVPQINLSAGRLNIIKSTILTKRWNLQNISEFKSDSSLVRVESYSNGLFDGGNQDYFDVILCGRIYVGGENTYNKLEFCPGADIYLPANQTQIADTLVVSGTASFPISVNSNAEGQQAGIAQNGGTVDGQYLYLMDSKAEGAVFTAIETVDLGNVDGWNITSPIPKTYYWVGGSGLWSEYNIHWATSSGGTVFYDRIPGALDEVIFDENSFLLSNGAVEVDQIKAYVKQIDFSDVNSSFNIDGGIEMWVFGDFQFNENGNSGLGLLKFPVDTAAFEIVSRGRRLAATLLFDHQGDYDLITGNEKISSNIFLRNNGKINLLGDLKLDSEFNATDGTFITNDHELEIPFFDFEHSSSEGNNGTLNIGNSHITVKSWKIGKQVNFSSDSSEINVLSPDEGAYFYGGDNDYQKVNLACLVYIQDDNSYDKLTITYGAKIFIKGVQSVKELVATGTSGNPIRINGGSFRKSSGKVTNQYLVLNNNRAFGGAEFIAENSIDGGGNRGWKIKPPLGNVDTNVLNVLDGEPLCGQAIETTLSFPPELLTTFRWFKDGAPLGSDSSTIVVSAEGDYYVELTNACGTVAQSNTIEIRREGPPEVPEIYDEGTTSICGDQPIDVKMNTDEQPRVHYRWMRNGVIFGEDEPDIDVDEVGTYTLRLTKGECVVDSRDSVVVIIKYDVPDVQSLQLAGNDTICLGDSSQFQVPYEVGTTYNWNNGDTIISTQTNYFEAKLEGTYILELENGCGSINANGSYFLKVKEVPGQQQIIVDGPDTFCYYDSVALRVPLEEEVTYQWLVNSSVPVENFSKNRAFTDTTGFYAVSMKNRCGVTVTDNVAINHLYLPDKRDIKINGDTIFCIGEKVVFSIDTKAGESWRWFDEGQIIYENIQSITTTEPGLYSAEITNICGTTPTNNIIPIEVKEIPPPTIVEEYYDQCGPGELTVKVSGGLDGNYVWRDENNQLIHGLNSEEIIVPINISKDYFVTLTNGYCEGPGSIVYMNVLDVPVADAGEDKTVIYGDEVILGGEHDYPNTYYLWTPDNWMNRNSLPTPKIRPQESTVYTVEAIGKNGCSSFDEVNVMVSFELVIPNTFTPNNDGTNDVWQIRNIVFHPGSKVEIFNRWGTKLYEASGYQNDWDGTYNGKNLPVDTYFYVIQLNDGNKPNKGPLTILR